MRAAFLFALIFFSRMGAWALERITPDDPEYKRIAAQIAEIKGNGGIDDQLKQENAALSQNNSPEDVAAINARIKNLEAARKLAYNKVIWMTIQSYGILLPGQALPEGTMYRPRVNAGRSVTWIPSFDDHTPHQIIDGNGRKLRMDNLDGARGLSGIDGISHIFPEAFTSPAALALIIVHEKRHFEQFTTKGVGDVFTPSELELEDYQKGKALLDSKQLVFDSATEETQLGGFLDQKIADMQKAAVLERYIADYTQQPAPQEDALPNSQADLIRIKEGADMLRTQVMRDSGVETLHKIAKQLCANSPDLVPHYLSMNEGAYKSACAAFPDKQAAHSWPDPTRGALGYCGSKAAEILSRCEDRAKIEADLRAAASPIEPSLPAPQPAPPPLIPSPGNVGEVLREAEKKALTQLYQDMADICSKLCRDPSDAWNQYAVLCRERVQARAMEDRYAQRRESPPADWEYDTNNSDCGREFFEDIMKDSNVMCFSDAQTETAWAHWFEDRAGELHQSYYPSQPAPPPAPTPRPHPNPAPRDPGDNNGGCPPGTHRTDRGGCTRAADPL